MGTNECTNSKKIEHAFFGLNYMYLGSYMLDIHYLNIILTKKCMYAFQCIHFESPFNKVVKK